MDLKETDILGDEIGDHWYYRSKAKAMTALLNGASPGKILDVGAGSAFFSRYLLAHTEASEAWCVDISYAQDSDDAEQGKPLHFRRSVDANDADLVLLMDVLEHVDDDVGLLRHYVDKAPSGANFLISVPAFQFLWSDHDVFLEHKRRYSLGQAEAMIRRAGLTITHGGYYFGAVFPIAAALRLASPKPTPGRAAASQLKRHSPPVNKVLSLLCDMELPFLRLNRVAGLTVFCLAQKR